MYTSHPYKPTHTHTPMNTCSRAHMHAHTPVTPTFSAGLMADAPDASIPEPQGSPGEQHKREASPQVLLGRAVCLRAALSECMVKTSAS